MEEQEKHADRKIGIFMACQQFSKAMVEIDHQKRIEIECHASHPHELIQNMAAYLGPPIFPIRTFSGYTLQIAYVPKGKDPEMEKYLWLNKLDETFIEHSSCMNIRGDLIQIPLWIHAYSDGAFGIRFGIFRHYHDILHAMNASHLGDRHIQIIPIEFKIDDFEKYFDTEIKDK